MLIRQCAQVSALSATLRAGSGLEMNPPAIFCSAAENTWEPA